MAVSLGRPAVDKETNGGRHSRDIQQRRTELGSPRVVIPGFQTAVDAIIQRGADLRAEPEAQTQGDVVQAADAGGFVVVIFASPEEGEGREHEVHDSVGVCHV